MPASDPHWLARTRLPRGTVQLRREIDPEVVRGYLEDAARYPGGTASEVCFPESEADAAALVLEARPLLVVGAQSSLTGGATPRGEIVVSTARLRAIGDWGKGGEAVTCGAGVVLRELDDELRVRRLYFPPVPTYDGATVGGVVSTDAAGAATFKHGTVRRWVDGLTVVLACGEVLDIARGDVTAHPDGWFEIERTNGERMRIPVPAVATPEVPKNSAGYRGGPALDLVDLFVGSEGTLGFVTEVRLRLAARPAWLAALVPVADDAEALALTAELRDEAARARAANRAGADVAAIEYMDAHSLEILRADRVAEREGVSLPAGAHALLLVQIELPAGYDRARAVDELSGAADAGPIASFCRILERRGLLADAVPALPGEDDRRRALFALREAVPDGVNRRIRERARERGEAISKAGGDVIVPFARFEELLARVRQVLDATGIESAIWGHISDGNIHPNLISRSAAEMDAARAAQLAIGRIAIDLGGSPLAEHGTGRNAAKQLLLRELHGADGVRSMRATKRALDPDGLFAPGVLFSVEE